jgi:hypothetical protein
LQGTKRGIQRSVSASLSMPTHKGTGSQRCWRLVGNHKVVLGVPATRKLVPQLQAMEIRLSTADVAFSPNPAAQPNKLTVK